MKRLYFLSVFIFTIDFCYGQDTINIDGIHCGIHGSSKEGSKTYYLNQYKNRYSFPDSNAFEPSITIHDLLRSGDPDQFDQNKAVTIQGFVFDVKVGGVEACNCKTKDAAFRDTHIEITPDEDHTGPHNRIIAEVTPRIRELMALKGMNWSSTELHGLLKGSKVEITGWLFYDAEHEDASYANDPEDQIGRMNWRGSCWEIHPITSIKLLPVTTDLHKNIEAKKVNTNTRSLAPSSVPESTESKTKTLSPSTLPAQPEESNHTFVYILGLLFLIALVIIIILIVRWNKNGN
jgi:hypothetical protein